jgi:hypothetical protein
MPPRYVGRTSGVSLLRLGRRGADKRSMGLGERRFDYRAPRGEKVEFQWNNAARETITMAGELVDLSQSGARLHSVRPVPVNTSIRFAVNNQERTGTVRYCLKRMRGYALGILFDSAN